MQTEDFIRDSIIEEYRSKRYSEPDIQEIAEATVNYWRQNSFAGKGNVFKALLKQAKEEAKKFKPLPKGRSNG